MLLKARASLYRRSYYEFVKAAWPVVEQDQFVDNWHIKAICEHLEAVYDGRIKNLLVNIPPGMMKSLLHCVFFPAWVWSKDPTRRFFYASYDATLSMRDSSKCRQLLDSEWYKLLFPGVVEFTKDQNQKGRYQNTAGGYRMATSVGGHAMGEHPHFIFADDPNNAKTIESEIARKEVEDWWTQVIGTRGLTVDSRRVVVQQRLHSRDLTGICLELGGYDHLCLEMRCERPGRTKTALGFVDPRQEGELLCPQLIGEAKLHELETKVLGPYGTASQMQQRPVPRTGGLFNADKLQNNIVDAAPADLVYHIRCWDSGASAKGDPTAGVKMAKQLSTGRYYILDVRKGNWDASLRLEIQRSTAMADVEDVKEVRILQRHKTEPGSGGKDQADNFIKNLAGFWCDEKRDTGAKEVRADPLASQVNAGNVFLVKGEWNREFIEECRVAPKGAHDDQWDAAASCFNWIEFETGGELVPAGWTFGIPGANEPSDYSEYLRQVAAAIEMNRID